MTTRFIQSKTDRDMLITWLNNMPPPYTVSVTQGNKRSLKQNRLQREFIKQIAEQRPDMTAEEWRGYCKLTIGVPILRDQNESFREKYDRLIKGRPYEEKMEMMMEPIDLPVTRIMTTKQKTEYLDTMIRHFAEQGVVLTAEAG